MPHPPEVENEGVHRTPTHRGRLLARLRRTRPRELIGILAPKGIDFLLFELAPDNARTDVAPTGDVEIRRFDPATPSGFDAIDAGLTDHRHCYAIIIDGDVAHQSWLFTDLVMLAQFGFDPRVPVIGECATSSRYRGMRLYPHTLQHIAQDVFGRGLADRLFMWVAPDNVPSIRGIERAGFTRAARLRGFKIGGLLVWRNVEREGD